MKTLMFYINSLNKGGAERVLLQLAERFSACGYRAVFVTSFRSVNLRWWIFYHKVKQYVCFNLNQVKLSVSSANFLFGASTSYFFYPIEG